MAVAGSSTTDVALAVFDDHLRRVRGVYPEVRRSYGRVAGEFLGMVFGDGPVDLGCLSACDVVGFVFEATVRYRPSTLQGVTTALRSFLRFLRVEGVRDDRLEEAVPKVPLRRLAAVPRYLGSGELGRLIASLDQATRRRGCGTVRCCCWPLVWGCEPARSLGLDWRTLIGGRERWRSARGRPATARFCRSLARSGRRSPANFSAAGR